MGDIGVERCTVVFEPVVIEPVVIEPVVRPEEPAREPVRVGERQ